MTDSTDLDGLIGRLEGATGADRELDCEIWCQMFAPDVVAVDFGINFPSYTASIDASLALVKVKLPGCAVVSASHDFTYVPGKGGGIQECSPWAYLKTPRADGRILERADAKTQPLAILLALLRALRSQEAEGG